MRDKLGDLLDLVFALIDAFESSSIDYAFGGAIAYSTWGEPRATRDVDLNVWLPPTELARCFDILERLGARLEREQAERDASGRGMFVARFREIRIDVFVPSIPFYESARKQRRRVSFDGRPTWVLSPETLAVFKLLFHRPKDLADVQRMLELQGSGFDRGFVTGALQEMLNPQDEKLLEWERIQKRVASSH